MDTEERMLPAEAGASGQVFNISKKGGKMGLFSEMGQGWINTVPVSMLDMWVYEGTQNSLCINDGRIVGCEKAETPGAATPRESK